VGQVIGLGAHRSVAGGGDDVVTDLRAGGADDDVDGSGEPGRAEVGGGPLGVAAVGDQRAPIRPDDGPAERAPERRQPADVRRVGHEQRRPVEPLPNGVGPGGVADGRELAHALAPNR
jgi:hypothetical protein